MGKNLEKKSGTFTLLELYQHMIAPKLKEIDITLRTCDTNISITETAKLLDESEENILNIMSKLHLTKIDRSSFIKIMKNGCSPLCGLLQRELSIGSPYTYTCKDIAYIYNLDIDEVKDVCNRLHIKEITPYTMPEVFAQISV